MAAEDDPLDHYRVLGLAPNATHAQIAHAYREWAKTYHPDLSGSDDSRDFLRIKAAYDTLKDATRRAGYDAGARRIDKPADGAAGAASSQGPVAAVHCSVCDTIPAQPRYCIFHRVISAFLECRVEHRQGVYCPRCAASRSLRESSLCWLFGWWSLKGLLRTPVALWRNVQIGEKPRQTNARLLIDQAQYHLGTGHEVLAQECLRQAARLAEGDEAEKVATLRHTIGQPSGRRARNDWALWRHPGALAQALPWLLLAGIVLSLPSPLSALSSSRRSASASWQAGSAGKTQGANQDQRYVAAKAATIWIDQNGRYTSGGFLPQYTTIEVQRPSSNPGFVIARLPDGQSAILATEALAAGDGTSARLQHCQEPMQDAPHNGEVLRRAQSGRNEALVTNRGGDEVVVKFRDQEGAVAVALFVARRSQALIEGLPEGSFRVEFATGRHWNRKCGLFEQAMNPQRFAALETFRSWDEVQVRQGKRLIIKHPDFAEYVIPPDLGGSARPEPIDPEVFIRD